jgi:PAS domain S-box-containing protein
MPYEDDAVNQFQQDNEALREELETLKAEYQTIAETLHNREREVAALMGVPPQPVIARFDRDLRHTYVNSNVQLATGIPLKNYIGKTSREMGMPEQTLLLWEGALREVFKSKTEKTIEYSVMSAGRRWTFESRIVPEVDELNAVQSVLAVTRDISRQKRAETALLENYEILETIHRVGQALSGELDLQKLVQTVTDAATHLTGADFGAFVSNQLNERGDRYIVSSVAGLSPETFARFPIARTTQIFAPTLREGQKLRIDDLRLDSAYLNKIPLYDMPDGYHPTHSFLAYPVVSQGSEIVGGLFLGHPDSGMFTERHERIIEGLAAQAAVAIDNARLYNEARTQQEHLRITLASIGDAVIATDAQGRINFMNPVAQALTGWSDYDATNNALEDVFHIVNEETRQTVESPVVKVLREGNIVGLANHTLLLTKEGHEIPIDDSGAPIFDEDQNMMGVILVFRDITERKRSERALQESESRFRMLIEQASDAILIAKPHGAYVEANSAACKLLGYTRDEILQKNMLDLFIIPSDKPLREAELQQGKTLLIERDMIRKDGTLVPVEVSSKLLADGTVQAIARDITERRLSEQRINLLLELTSAFSQALTMSEIAEVVVDRALKALGGLLGTVALLIENGTMLELLNLRGLSPETVEKYRRTSLDFPGPLNDAIRANQIVWIETYDQYVKQYPHFAENIKRNGSHSTVCIPLTVNEQTIGGFSLSFAAEKPRNPDEEAFFMALAQQCAQSLERARLYEIANSRGVGQ